VNLLDAGKFNGHMI